MLTLPAAARLMWPAFAALLRARFAVWRRPFTQLVREHGVIDGSAAPPALAPDRQHAAEQIATALSRAAVPFGPLANCLVRCFAAATLMRHYGISYTIYCGADPAAPGRLDAHAWLRAGTLIIGDNPAGNRFTIMLTITHCS